MTPAIKALEKAKIPVRLHRYEVEDSDDGYGLAAAAALGLPPARVFKTLVALLDGDAKKGAVGMVPVDRQLSLKALAKACGAKKAVMATPEQAQRLTGYVVGGISPLGQRRRLPTVLDTSAQGFETINVSAGQRGLEVELSAKELLAVTGGKLAGIAAE